MTTECAHHALKYLIVMATNVNVYTCLDSNNLPHVFCNILFGLSEKIKSISAQRNLISKGLSYLLHVNSIGLSPVLRLVQINFGLNKMLSPKFVLSDLLSPNENTYFTFWIGLKTKSEFRTDS